MAPLLGTLLRRLVAEAGPSTEFRAQWVAPKDVFTVLLIVGGDVIGKALAQSAGNGYAPVTFSFGWAAYAIAATMSAFGENKLMPPPDCACKVINGESAYVRDNTSWVLGRMVRDFESWMDPAISNRVERVIDEKHEQLSIAAAKKAPHDRPIPVVERPKQAGLCVSFYQAQPAEPGKQQYDLVFFSGIVTTLVQLGVASISCGIWRDWSVLLLTAAGTTLAIFTGLLPQWNIEKWACRTNEHKKTFVLTRGNGAQHAIVVSDPEGVGLDLEDLAAGQTTVHSAASKTTRAAVLSLAFAWLCLLISASAIDANTWFLLAVGGLGIVQNLFVAGYHRRPKAFGIPLAYETVICRHRVMDALEVVEQRHPGLGYSMRETFFPGAQLREHEVVRWADYARIAKEKRAAEKAKRQTNA